MKSKKYTYGLYSVGVYVFLGLLIFLIGRFFYACGEWIFAVIKGDFSTSVLEWEFYLLILFFLIVWVYLAVGSGLNLYSKYILTDGGIEILMFNVWFYWKFIPWEKVESFELSPKVRRSWLLRVNTKLPIWHRRNARGYCYEDDSVIVVLERLGDWRGFKARVKKYLAEKNELAEE